jgi:hypothetical protein
MNATKQKKLNDKFIEIIKNNKLQTTTVRTCLLRKVNRLLRQGADINYKDKDNNTALIYACREDKTSLAIYLLYANADYTHIGKEGSALQIAYKKQQFNVVKKILKLSKWQNRYDHITPLFDYLTNKDLPISSGLNLEIMEAILKLDVRIIENKFEGKSPITYAAINNNAEALKILVENDANINSTDSYGRTPLHILLRKCYSHKQLNKEAYSKNEYKKQLDSYSKSIALLLENDAGIYLKDKGSKNCCELFNGVKDNFEYKTKKHLINLFNKVHESLNKQANLNS